MTTRLQSNWKVEEETLHPFVLVNYDLVDVLQNNKATMLMMSTRTIKGFVHLVIGSRNYQIALGLVTLAMGQIEDLLVRVERIKWHTTFMIIDINMGVIC